jgi:hypothetical protein
MTSFFRVCRRWAGSGAGVFCLTAAALFCAGPVRAQAQAAAAQPAIEVSKAISTPTIVNEARTRATGESSSVSSELSDGQCELSPQSVPDAPNPQAQQSQSQGQSQATAQSQSTPQAQTQGQDQSTPQAQPQGSAPSEKLPQTSRIMNIIPNFRAVSTDEKLPPMSVKDKFIGATEDSFDYSAIFIPLMLAGYSDATRATPEFGHGAPAYARYFWHTAVDQTSENYWVEFIVPAITHEDTRYYTLGRGGFMKRMGYSLSRAVVTRNDKGNDEFNFSEVVGAGAASGVSSLYYPSKERSLGNVGTEWGLDVAIDSMSFVVKEFWPDVNHALFHRGDKTGSANRGGTNN